MSKDDLNIKDNTSLFKEERYVQQRENKKQFEAPCSEQETAEALAYSKSAEYMERTSAARMWSSIRIKPASRWVP